MLGYPEAEEAYLGSQHSYKNTSGPGSGNNFILDDVHCTGTEYDIFHCPANAEGVHNCGASEWAAVKCLLTYNAIGKNFCFVDGEYVFFIYLSGHSISMLNYHSV